MLPCTLTPLHGWPSFADATVTTKRGLTMKQLTIGFLLGSLIVGGLWLWDRKMDGFKLTASHEREDKSDDPYWNVKTTDARYWSNKDRDNEWMKADMEDCHGWVSSLSKQLGQYLMWEDRVNQFSNCMKHRKGYEFKDNEK